MKSLKDFIAESGRPNPNKEMIEACNKMYGSEYAKLHEECNKYAWDPKGNKPIDNKELEDFFEENWKKFDDLVKTKIKFADAVESKDPSMIDKFAKDGKVWYSYFDPYITSAGFTESQDNRDVMFGCSEAICFLYNMLNEIGLKNPGSRMADVEYELIRRIKEKELK